MTLCAQGGSVWRPAALGLAVLVVLLDSVIASPPAGANWFTKLVRESGESGGKLSGKFGHGSLDDAARHVQSLPQGTAGVSLAAHATHEGHWQFVNRSGDIFTAGTPDELTRVTSALSPEAAPGTRLIFHLSDESVLVQRARLKDLPPDASLRVVIGKTSYPLIRRANGDAELVFAEVRPNVVVPMTERPAVMEAIFQLGRPIEASRVRVLSLTPGGPDAFTRLPRFDAGTKSALVDSIDPNSLSRALSGLKGQTAVISGRIEAGQLFFRPASGAERSLPMDEIARAAAASDVNLVVLQSVAPRQPGGRNWLWQKVEVAGLDDALKRASFADFLNGLATGRGPLAVEVMSSSNGRTALRAIPSAAKSEPITAPISGPLADWLTDAVSNVTGNVVTSAVDVIANSAERQRELDLRLIPGIPSILQIGFLASLIAGLMGLGVSRGWWSRVWPPEVRSEYAGPVGYHAARIAKFLAFVLIFLPLTGVPAFVTTVAMQLWAIFTAPWRAIQWIGGRFKSRGSAATG